MVWVRWFGAGIVLLMAVLLAGLSDGHACSSVPTVVLLEGESTSDDETEGGEDD